jgi:hypothetical protein
MRSHLPRYIVCQSRGAHEASLTLPFVLQSGIVDPCSTQVCSRVANLPLFQGRMMVHMELPEDQSRTSSTTLRPYVIWFTNRHDSFDISSSNQRQPADLEVNEDFSESMSVHSISRLPILSSKLQLRRVLTFAIRRTWAQFTDSQCPEQSVQFILVVVRCG